MPNSVKKTVLPQETDAASGSDMDDFDFESLDELATLMVDALTIPMPTDVRNSKGPGVDGGEEPAPRPPKRLN